MGVRALCNWLERWAILDEDNSFIGVGKCMLIVAIPVMALLLSIVYLDSLWPSFTLKKAEWRCTQSHQEWESIMIGKVPSRQLVNVCDEYKRRNGD